MHARRRPAHRRRSRSASRRRSPPSTPALRDDRIADDAARVARAASTGSTPPSSSPARCGSPSGRSSRTSARNWPRASTAPCASISPSARTGSSPRCRARSTSSSPSSTPRRQEAQQELLGKLGEDQQLVDATRRPSWAASGSLDGVVDAADRQGAQARQAQAVGRLSRRDVHAACCRDVRALRGAHRSQLPQHLMPP